MSQNRVVNKLLYGSKTLEEQLACAQREYRLREKAYAKWVARGSMDAGKADHEMGCMAAIIDTLKDLIDRGGAQPSLFGDAGSGQ